MKKAEEFHCIPAQGKGDTGFCVKKSEHGAIRGLATHVVEYAAYRDMVEALNLGSKIKHWIKKGPECAASEIYMNRADFDEFMAQIDNTLAKWVEIDE